MARGHPAISCASLKACFLILDILVPTITVRWWRKYINLYAEPAFILVVCGYGSGYGGGYMVVVMGVVMVVVT